MASPGTRKDRPVRVGWIITGRDRATGLPVVSGPAFNAVDIILNRCFGEARPVAVNDNST